MAKEAHYRKELIIVAKFVEKKKIPCTPIQHFPTNSTHLGYLNEAVYVYLSISS
jgi:hypothetical protein